MQSKSKTGCAEIVPGLARQRHPRARASSDPCSLTLSPCPYHVAMLTAPFQGYLTGWPSAKGGTLQQVFVRVNY